MQQQGVYCEFSNGNSWIILSPIEQSIKRKIEAVGTPLKDWDIQINYGIKTGFNDAFIISTEKREEILANCQSEDERTRTAELIRPILRGRDIKRYGYDWAGLWLINTHNGIKGKLPRIHIEDYPAVAQPVRCQLENLRVLALVLIIYQLPLPVHKLHHGVRPDYPDMVHIQVHSAVIEPYYLGSGPVRDDIPVLAVSLHVSGEAVSPVRRRNYIRIRCPVSGQVRQQVEILVYHYVVFIVVPLRSRNLGIDDAL